MSFILDVLPKNLHLSPNFVPCRLQLSKQNNKNYSTARRVSMAPKDHKSCGKQNFYTKKNMKVVKNYKNHQNRASKSDKSEILKKKCMVD